MDKRVKGVWQREAWHVQTENISLILFEARLLANSLCTNWNITLSSCKLYRSLIVILRNMLSKTKWLDNYWGLNKNILNQSEKLLLKIIAEEFSMTLRSGVNVSLSYQSCYNFPCRYHRISSTGVWLGRLEWRLWLQQEDTELLVPQRLLMLHSHLAWNNCEKEEQNLSSRCWQICISFKGVR